MARAMEMSKDLPIVMQYNSFDPEGGVSEGKNPVIFLHAMLCSKEIWMDIPQHVANKTGRRVYTYDARNHGRSEHSTKSDFRYNVADLFTLMKLVENDGTKVAPNNKAILVGHDMGGITAISAALAKPEIVEKVIIIEMYTKKVPDFLIGRAQIFMKTWTECVRKLPKSTQTREVTAVSVENLYKELPDEMKETNEKMSYLNANFQYEETDDGHDVLYNTENIATALEELKNQGDHEGIYNGPAYFFYGEKSHYNIGNEESAIKEHFPKAKFIKFEGGSHFFIADAPDKLTEEISKSINESY